ncbi:hypothetical protein INT46_002449 [Mucor plumbeus]|uniref:Uncharacterized protein n=1 Tax=Mucor plumbeus TaxID=97098 RepID=A0A8H7QVQ6_9FUNG|nr:hypothetical protein INT46_002449 [Mucor plumbeus]
MEPLNTMYDTDVLVVDGMSTVDGLSTASTTRTLVQQLNNVSMSSTTMQRAARQHNDSSTETIMSGTTGQLIPIPFAGNDYNDRNISGTIKQTKSWWGRYGFGVRFDFQIFCTVSRRQANGYQAIIYAMQDEIEKTKAEAAQLAASASSSTVILNCHKI